MNDADIIKALELSPKCNPVEGRCSICPYLLIDDCSGKFPKDALDLINRQKAEIDQQKSDIATLKDSNVNLQELYYAEKEKVAKAKQKVIDVCRTLKTARAEAITEFEERLKVHAYYINFPIVHRVIDEDDIDQIAKEMKEGVNNA